MVISYVHYVLFRLHAKELTLTLTRSSQKS